MPLRAGSKSIPDKNVKNIAGRPLFAWSLDEALHSNCFDEIYVASDSSHIRETVAATFPVGVEVIDRSPESASDTASTEAVMVEFQQRVAFDVLCLIQATSPLTRAADFSAAKENFIAESLDSLLTAVRSNRFLWNAQAQSAELLTCRAAPAPGFEGSYVENGAFYLTAANILKRDECRLGGRIGIHAMPPGNRARARRCQRLDGHRGALGTARGRCAAARALAPRKVVVIDVDGTMTDGVMVYGPEGEVLKNFTRATAKVSSG